MDSGHIQSFDFTEQRMSSPFSIKLLVPKSTEPNTRNSQHTACLARQALVPYLHPLQRAVLIPQEKLLSHPETASKSSTSSGPPGLKHKLQLPALLSPKGCIGWSPARLGGLLRGLETPGDYKAACCGPTWTTVCFALLFTQVFPWKKKKKRHLFNLTQLRKSLFSACLDTALNNYVKNNGIMFLSLSNQRLWIREVLFNQSSLC